MGSGLPSGAEYDHRNPGNQTPNAWEREGVTYRLKPLAYEPGIYGEHRYVLFTNGKIQRMDIESIYQIMNGKHK
jgi:hypothetical protein